MKRNDALGIDKMGVRRACVCILSGRPEGPPFCNNNIFYVIYTVCRLYFKGLVKFRDSKVNDYVKIERCFRACYAG